MRSAAMSVSCNTGRGHCLPVLFMFSEIVSHYIWQGSWVSTAQAEKQEFSHTGNGSEAHLGFSRVIFSVSLETIPFSASSLVRSTSRECGKVSPGLTVLECAWEGSGGLDWQCGHLIPSPSAVFQNNRATETTPVLSVLNGLYSRILNVQKLPCPHPGPAF